MTVTNIKNYSSSIQAALPFCLQSTNFSFGKKYQGKVRDNYDLEDRLLLITTDRLSAFDRVLTSVPYKGQVLNLTSAWWFEKTAHIVPNHMIAIPDPNVILAKKCTPFPIEFVVRGYITGSTDTALWTQYKKGVRNYCGHALPEDLRKNQRLTKILLTPTTKDKYSDKPISAAEIVEQGFMSEEDWNVVSAMAMRLFEYGTQIATQHGLILVDTKYEFGKDSKGNIMLIDEIHTPDSSRYWLAASYEERFAQHKEPENIDKEFLRLWFVDNCDPYHDGVLPQAPNDLIVTLSSRYIQLYETITKNAFQFSPELRSMEERIMKNLTEYL